MTNVQQYMILPQTRQHWPGGITVAAPGAQFRCGHIIETNYKWAK